VPGGGCNVTALALLPALAALVLSLVFTDGFRFLGRLHGVGVAAGIELAAVGIAFLAAAAAGLRWARRRGTLAKRGAFGLCRHPIGAWMVWSLTPALALLLDSWLFLAAAPLVYAAARLIAKPEDDALWERFGREFAGYEFKVRRLLPLPRIRPIRFTRYLRAAGVLASIAVFMLGVYFAAVRPVILRLGVSAREAAAPMPGDELVSRPVNRYTQAVLIRAPADEVWKWLVQVGYKRAGWYNIDAINRLVGPEYFIDGGRSSTRIHPELQDLKVGDKIFLVPVMGMTVTDLQPPRLLVMAGDPSNPEAESNASWTYVLTPLGPDSCRLVVRFRSSHPPGLLWTLMNGIVNEIGSAMLQQQAMLAGIRARAEGASRAVQPGESPPA
jgi:protein-S-isoprenylcysteine O-methyltransferase Ste14